MSTTMNGRSLPRRTLNDSIGRLDEMLDGLSDAIPTTIRQTLQDSVGVAVAEGVKAALVEIMTNPDVLARLHLPVRDAIPLQPSFFGRLIAKVRDAIATAWNWVVPRAATLKANATGAAGEVRRRGANAVDRLRWIASCRRPIGIAITVGLLLAGVAYVSSPTCASLLTGLAATMSALGVQFALWARRTMNRLLLA